MKALLRTRSEYMEMEININSVKMRQIRQKSYKYAAKKVVLLLIKKLPFLSRPGSWKWNHKVLTEVTLQKKSYTHDSKRDTYADKVLPLLCESKKWDFHAGKI